MFYFVIYNTVLSIITIQDFDSRLILYLNRPVIVFNVDMYVEVLQLFSGLQYSCSLIQGDISVDAIASLKDYSIVKSKVIFYKVISFHQSCIYYAPGDDSPHGGILLLLCPYVCMYVCPSSVKVFG